MDIIEAIQQKVDEITREDYKDDECPPEFTVSLLYEEDSHKILLTVKHLGSTFSKVIFPNLEMRYGYESLSKEMQFLYNRTM